ncbi:sensor histidine kinase [Qipengyuania sp. DGS5-3]|uniref:sensor histidine kinase n=1 Tax=Qipengyuania sp. DGS5-3 TaxID=3349632 RepID=UPI0036D2C12C
MGLRLARGFEALGHQERISAWVEIEPLLDADRHPAGCELGIVNWNSEPLSAEESAEALELQREISRNLAEAIIRLDPKQNVLSAQCTAPDLAKLQAKLAGGVGKPWTDHVELEGNSHQQPMHWRLLDGAQLTVEGSDRVWSTHIEPLGHPDPGSTGFALHLLSDTAPALHDHAAGTAASDSAPALGKDLSPALRDPINRIIANAETIRTKLAGPLAKEYTDYAADIASAGQHLLALIDDLSDLDAVEAEDFDIAREVIDLAEVARQSCNILNGRAKEKGITLVPPAKGEAEYGIGEFRRVLQILINLVNNAIRYSPEGSQVWVRLDDLGEQAMITVADQGHGLDSEQQAKVFEKFERLGRSGDGGSGLGLYISRKIARAMDGDLTIESAKGQGARFTLSVPASAGPKPDPASTDRSSP